MDSQTQPESPANVERLAPLGGGRRITGRRITGRRSVNGVLGLVGNTPLVRLTRLAEGLRGVEIWAKAEWRNPGGSVKDRPALRIVEEAEGAGALTPRKALLDATSGNTGIGYALI